MNPDDPVESLWNLGPNSGRWLRAVGIETVADLRKIGPVTAYRLVKQNESNATLSLLWALAGGLQGKNLLELTADEKQMLQAELEA